MYECGGGSGCLNKPRVIYMRGAWPCTTVLYKNSRNSRENSAGLSLIIVCSVHSRVTVGIISGYGVPPLLVLSLHLQVPSRISSCLLVPSFHPQLSTPSVPYHYHLLYHLHHHRRYLYSISLIALATLYTLVYIHTNTCTCVYVCVYNSLSSVFARAVQMYPPTHPVTAHTPSWFTIL